jgi:hypothetical protein
MAVPLSTQNRDRAGWEKASSTWLLASSVVVLLVAAAVNATEDRSAAAAADGTRRPTSFSKGVQGRSLPSSEVRRTVRESASSRAQSASAERLAAADKAPRARPEVDRSDSSAAVGAAAARMPDSPIARARRTIAECHVRYQAVDDYTCTLFKRERIDRRLTPVHIMALKIRSKPQSIYLKFHQPARGREAIYVSGRHGGKLLAHDVGLNKLLAGTLQLEPTSARAMEDCRHPITEAGIGPLLDTLAKRWAIELNPAESLVTFRDDVRISTRPCEMIESTHPERRPEFLYYRVRVYIDLEIGLPIRFEAYDWPKTASSEPELQEEYTYLNLKLNVGLTDHDFETSNAAYSFGRF